MKKLEHEYIFNYYANEQYTMHNIYKGMKYKDKLTCPVGHKIEMSFNSFRQGKRCFKCFGSEKNSHDYVFEFYANEQYIMHNIYINALTKDQLTCPVGHEIKITFNKFQLGGRCRICYLENNRGENHPSYNKEDRTRRIRTNYLSFDLKKLHVLQDDPNYNNYIQSQNEAKLSDNVWSRTEYHIDHIFPRIAFIDNNLDKLYNQTIIKEICNLRENLRIVHQKENGSKSGKYNNDEFMNWFNQKTKNLNTKKFEK